MEKVKGRSIIKVSCRDQGRKHKQKSSPERTPPIEYLDNLPSYALVGLKEMDSNKRDNPSVKAGGQRKR